MDKIKEGISGGRAAPIAILGVPFDNINTAETIHLVEQMVLARRPHYLATANVDFLVQAAKDVELRRILFDAHLVLCDGTPLVWASKLLGNPLPERVAGSDLVPLLLKLAAEKGYRPFLLGATPDSIEAAVKKIKENYPDLQLAGYYSPPFNRLLEMDHEAIRERIIQSQPDMLFVGFGCPKQEKWINMHYRSLGVPVSVGIGGTIDFLAGKLARAPRWMQRSGTEWIYRMLQEPRRLAGRYAVDLWYFGRRILAQFWRLRFVKRPRKPAGHAKVFANDPVFNTAQLPARLDFEEVHNCKLALESLIEEPKSLLIDCSRVQFIDSTGVGLLIRLQKHARIAARQMVLVAPSEQTVRALKLMNLSDFFLTAADLNSARAFLNQMPQSATVHLKATKDASLPALAWDGELTAANAEEIWVSTMDYISARSLVQHTLSIDLTNLHFIDSTGLSVMIRAKKYGGRHGVKVRFFGLGANVLNVVQLSRLEDFLLNEHA